MLFHSLSEVTYMPMVYKCGNFSPLRGRFYVPEKLRGRREKIYLFKCELESIFQSLYTCCEKKLFSYCFKIDLSAREVPPVAARHSLKLMNRIC